MPFKFRGLFNTKAILVEGQYCYNLILCWEDTRVHAFAKGIRAKVTVIAGLELEWNSSARQPLHDRDFSS